MDISNRFSLEDFLAYFFPGLTGTLGVYVALLLTPLRGWLLGLSADIVMGILLLFVGYIVGVFLSGFAEPITKFYQRFKRPGVGKTLCCFLGTRRRSLLPTSRFLDCPRKWN